MAGNRITWDIGTIAPDTHYVYRDSAPMDIDSLPTPVATLGGDVGLYEDIDSIIEGNTYYYRVDAEKVGLYILGKEIEFVSLPFPKTALVNDVFNDGTIVSTYTFNGDANDLGNNINFSHNNFGSGKLSQAAIFDGTDSGGIDVSGTSLDSLLDSDNFTASAWVYFNSLDCSFLNSGGSGTGWDLGVSSSGDIEIVSSQSSTISYAAGISANEWVHIILSNDNGTTTVYHNGSPVITQTMGYASGSDDSGIGAVSSKQSNKQSLDGKIDQMRFFNRGITDDEAVHLYEEIE